MSRRSSMRISPQINNNRETFKTKTQKKLPIRVSEYHHVSVCTPTNMQTSRSLVQFSFPTNR